MIGPGPISGAALIGTQFDWAQPGPSLNNATFVDSFTESATRGDGSDLSDSEMQAHLLPAEEIRREQTKIMMEHMQSTFIENNIQDSISDLRKRIEEYRKIGDTVSEEACRRQIALQEHVMAGGNAESLYQNHSP